MWLLLYSKVEAGLGQPGYPGYPGYPGHVLSGSSRSHLLYKMSGSDPDVVLDRVR